MKIALPKTRGLWDELNEAEDTSKLNKDRQQIKEEIDFKNQQLDKVDSMEDYRSISQEIQALQDQLKEKEIEIRLQPARGKQIYTNIAPKIKDSYNQEFKPYHDKYLKLDKELRIQLTQFAENTDAIVKEMKHIENIESSFHMLKNKNGVAARSEFIKLPADTRTLTKERPWMDWGDFSLTSSVKTVIDAIKRINK